MKYMKHYYIRKPCILNWCNSVFKTSCISLLHCVRHYPHGQKIEPSQTGAFHIFPSKRYYDGDSPCCRCEVLSIKGVPDYTKTLCPSVRHYPHGYKIKPSQVSAFHIFASKYTTCCLQIWKSCVDLL